MSYEEITSRDLLDHVTFGVLGWLEQRSDVTEIEVMDYEPANQVTIDSWEQSNLCKLPDDLKQFYRTINGLLISWSMQLQGAVIPVGLIEVNPVESLNRICLQSNCMSDVTLFDIYDEWEENEKDKNGYVKPSFKNKCFELSSDGKHGKVCVVYYSDGSSSIWLLDRSLHWHFLALTFQQYFRMLITNIGIKGWQYLCTPFGPSPETEQWFSYCLPQRLLSNNTASDASLVDALSEKKGSRKIDFMSLFKQKGVDKKKGGEQLKQSQQGGKNKLNTNRTAPGKTKGK